MSAFSPLTECPLVKLLFQANRAPACFPDRMNCSQLYEAASCTTDTGPTHSSLDKQAGVFEADAEGFHTTDTEAAATMHA